VQFLGDLFADRSAADAVDPSSCRPNRSGSALASFWVRLAAPRPNRAGAIDVRRNTYAQAGRLDRPGAEQFALAIEDKRIGQAPRADPAVIDSTAKIGEPLVVLLRPSTIFAASVLEV
jgi:hypothetical protein